MRCSIRKLFFKRLCSIHRTKVTNIVSSRSATPHFSEGTPRPFWVPALSEANLKSYPPLSEIYPNWCMQIVRNILIRRYYVSYYTKSIKNIINIPLFIFRFNPVFTTDTYFGEILPLMFFMFVMQEEWSGSWRGSGGGEEFGLVMT